MDAQFNKTKPKQYSKTFYDIKFFGIQTWWESTFAQKPNVAQRTLYDYRGRDGTGTADSPATGSNMQSYVVRKLADGNCWMAENLQLKLVSGKSIKVGAFAGGEADWTPNWTNGSTNPYNYAITQNYRENIAVTDYRSISHNNWYYTWHAAVAASSATQTSYTPTQSICPKGWRLPNGSNNATKSFYNLITTKYGLSRGDAINNDPHNFYPAGYYSIGSLNGSAGGYYWSATSYGNNDAYDLDFTSSGVNPQGYSNKYVGISVRCVSLQL